MRCSSEENPVGPNDIIVDESWNAENKDFWNHHGRSKQEYMDYVSSGQVGNSKPIKVNECGEKYVLVDRDIQRIAASKELERPVKVNVADNNVYKNQSPDEEEEMSM